MATEYIKKKDVLDYIASLNVFGYIETNGVKVTNDICALPTKQIVCCKECKSGRKVQDVSAPNLYFCRKNCLIYHTGDFYCAYGEEKTNESFEATV